MPNLQGKLSFISLDFVPEAPIDEFDGFRIKKGRIFEGKKFTMLKLIYIFYSFHALLRYP
jgi:hypothetical protein